MNLADALPVAIWALSAYAWFSAVVLVRAACCEHPRIGALSERALVAVIIATFGTVYSVVIFNAEILGYIVDIDTMRVVRRLAVMMLLLVPVWWSWMFATGRLGGNDE